MSSLELPTTQKIFIFLAYHPLAGICMHSHIAVLIVTKWLLPPWHCIHNPRSKKGKGQRSKRIMPALFSRKANLQNAPPSWLLLISHWLELDNMATPRPIIGLRE